MNTAEGFQYAGGVGAVIVGGLIVAFWGIIGEYVVERVQPSKWNEWLAIFLAGAYKARFGFASAVTGMVMMNRAVESSNARKAAAE